MWWQVGQVWHPLDSSHPRSNSLAGSPINSQSTLKQLSINSTAAAASGIAASSSTTTKWQVGHHPLPSLQLPALSLPSSLCNHLSAKWSHRHRRRRPVASARWCVWCVARNVPQTTTTTMMEEPVNPMELAMTLRRHQEVHQLAVVLLVATPT